MSVPQTPESLRELRRGQIVAVARKIVAEEGLEALTIGSLESRLSFSRGVITYHFANKEDIVHAVLDSAIAEIDAATLAELKGAPSLEEKVRAMLRANVRGFVEHAEAARILLSFWGRIGSDRRIRKTNATLYAGYRKGAARLLEAGQAQGVWQDVDVEGMASLLVGIVIGIATQSHFEKGAIDWERTLDEAVKTVLARLSRK
jgi:AcrR family transcriptional regulator